jgi:hypothetical protein
MDSVSVNDGELSEIGNSFPSELHLLLPGTYHGEDIFQDASRKKWFGVYQEKGQAAIRRTELSFIPVFDPILDDEGGQSALNIRAVSDSIGLLFLIADMGDDASIAETKLTTWDRTKPAWPVELKPGTVFRMDATYQLRTFAEGNGMENYRVEWVVAQGKSENQVLAAADFMDDALMHVHWVGDLNGDGMPDLLLNTSHKYSYSQLVLFLSSAREGDILHRAASFRYTAC